MLRNFQLFSHDDKVWILFPKLLAKLDKERVGIGCVEWWSPESSDFGGNNDFPLENLIVIVSWDAIGLFLAEKFLVIQLIDERPVECIVKVEAIDFVFFYNLQSLIDQQIPRLFLTIVERSCVLITYWPPITAVVEYDSSFLVHSFEKKALVTLTHSARTHPYGTINQNFDA